jgi:hypothetical protein
MTLCHRGPSDPERGPSEKRTGNVSLLSPGRGLSYLEPRTVRALQRAPPGDLATHRGPPPTFTSRSQTKVLLITRRPKGSLLFGTK